MYKYRHIGGLTGGVRVNKEEIEQRVAVMAAEGYVLIPKRFRGRLNFEKWDGPTFSYGPQKLLLAVPPPKKRRKRRKR